MKNATTMFRSNRKIATAVWGDLPILALRNLRNMTEQHALSVAAGDFQFFDGRLYVTHTGLLHIAVRNKCAGIHASLEEAVSEASENRWIFKATVYKSPRSRGFVGFGDADPSNVSPLVHGAEMRVAETRAVNRALRKAYGIGLCSVEELGTFSGPQKPLANVVHSNDHRGSNDSSNRQPRLRDQLCLLIRQHNLNPSLVKAYAADFCGTATLKEASRDLVESFISELASTAKNDRDSLLCKLNSYAQTAEVKP